MGDSYNGGLRGNLTFCQIQLKFRFYEYKKRWHTSWKFKLEITSNKKVIAKKPLTILYEMNSKCQGLNMRLCQWMAWAVTWCEYYPLKKRPLPIATEYLSRGPSPDKSFHVRSSSDNYGVPKESSGVFSYSNTIKILLEQNWAGIGLPWTQNFFWTDVRKTLRHVSRKHQYMYLYSCVLNLG